MSSIPVPGPVPYTDISQEIEIPFDLLHSIVSACPTTQNYICLRPDSDLKTYRIYFGDITYTLNGTVRTFTITNVSSYYVLEYTSYHNNTYNSDTYFWNLRPLSPSASTTVVATSFSSSRPSGQTSLYWSSLPGTPHLIDPVTITTGGDSVYAPAILLAICVPTVFYFLSRIRRSLRLG